MAEYVPNPRANDAMTQRAERVHPLPSARLAGRCDRVGHLEPPPCSHRRALSAPQIPIPAPLDCSIAITVQPVCGVPCVHSPQRQSFNKTNNFKTITKNILVAESAESGLALIRTKRLDTSCTRISIYAVVAVALVCVGVVLARDYIKYVLLSLETSNFAVSFLVFLVLFTAVSFPMTWGYILLNVAAGYLYGPATGVVVVMTCALFGVLNAHLVIRGCLRQFVWERIANESMRALVRVVESESGAKVVALARLTPIPFGLQNALFAMAHMGVARYMLASMVGMLPSQGLHIYIGSTLRSMEEVISSSSPSSSFAYAVFAAQLLMAVALLAFVLHKAKQELSKAMEQNAVKAATLSSHADCQPSRFQ